LYVYKFPKVQMIQISPSSTSTH